jgi:hypothetical protein
MNGVPQEQVSFFSPRTPDLGLSSLTLKPGPSGERS